MVKYLGLHETVDVHELLTFKSICLTKSTTMSALAQDEDLKAILTNDMIAGQQQVKELQQLLTNREEQQ
jgi:similar to spore coat protein